MLDLFLLILTKGLVKNDHDTDIFSIFVIVMYCNYLKKKKK